MVSDLAHEEALAHLRGSDEQIHSPAEQAVYDGRPALIHVVKKFCHGDRFKIGWVRHPPDLTLPFLKTLDFFIIFGYTAVST
jgi:hypothetical protein